MADKDSDVITKNLKDKAKLIDGIFLTNDKLSQKFDFAIESPDAILAIEGYSYYNEMMAKDPHVYSIINTRKRGAASVPYYLEPFNDSDEAAVQKDFVAFLLRSIPIEDHLFDILNAIPFGFSIHEIVTKNTSARSEFPDKKIIETLIFHEDVERFTFKSRPKIGFDMFYTAEHSVKEIPLPEDKFLHSSFDTYNPNGKPLLEKLYWYYWFKKESGFKYWALFLERFGSPTPVLKYPSGDTSGTQQDTALAILDELQDQTGVCIPDDFSFEFLKTSPGDVSYPTMIEKCNAEMSKAVLGATQTVEEGSKGSYALSNTHSEVRSEYKVSDTVLPRRVIQHQIINRFVGFNFVDPMPPNIFFGVKDLPPEQRQNISSTGTRDRGMQRIRATGTGVDAVPGDGNVDRLRSRVKDIIANRNNGTPE